MKLTTGSRLGAYRIEKFLSAGGMGDVYLGRHVELGRRVAIKLLAEALARDETALKRFRREARAASSLNHPRICTLFDFVQEGDTSFLVLEYLEGETLEARMRRQALTFAEAARVAADVAEALDHAHAHGFVHRDLKPGNVMLTEQGSKVLDFGLVTATSRGERAISLTTTGNPSAPITERGVILGTMPYMAPEQLEGSAVDGRTDIYALGVMLYEMVTGRRAFNAATPVALAAEILQARPKPVQELEPAAPESLVRIIERCMARSPDERWQSARDLSLELRWVSSARQQLGILPAPRRTSRMRKWVGGGMFVTLTIASVLLVKALGPDTPPPREFGPIAFPVNAPAGMVFTEGVRNIPAVSPDGGRLLFLGTDASGKSRVFVREFSNQNAIVVPGTEGAFLPFWSADGASFAYFSDGKLWTHTPGGAPPAAVSDASLESRGGSWSNNTIIFAPGPRTGLSRVPSNSGPATAITTPNRARGEIGHLWPSFLPDGRRFLFFVSSDVDSVRGVYLGTLDGARAVRIIAATSNALYANGHLLYVRGRSLLAQPFDAQQAQLTGSARLLANDVFTTPDFGGAFSASGAVLAWWSASTKDVTRLVRFSATGTRLSEVSDVGHHRNVDLSRDGRHIALEVYDGSDGDIAIIDLDSRRVRPITTPATQERNAVWSPDGSRIAFVAEHADGWVIYTLELDAARDRQVLVRSETDVMPTSWSSDGRTLLFANRNARGNYDVMSVALTPGSTPIPVLQSEAHEISGQLSPGRKWLAYASSESNSFEIYIQPYPASGLKCQVSSGGGYDPHWSRDDNHLYYLDAGGTLMRSELTGMVRCPTSPPLRMFKTPIQTPGTARNHFAVSLSDGSLLFNTPASNPATWQINVLVDWLPR